MKNYLTVLRGLFWTKGLKAIQVAYLRVFIPGTYVCTKDATKIQLDIKRISEYGEVYHVTLHVGKEIKNWFGYFDRRALRVLSDDFEKTIAFLPEHGKLIYEGVEFVKTLVNN